MSLISIISDFATEFKDPIKALVVVGGGFVVKWVGGLIKSKTGINVDRRLHDLVKSGLNAAKAEIKKHGWDVKTVEGATKARDYAVKAIEKKRKALGIPKFTQDVLEDMVEDGLERLKEEARTALAKATAKVETASER